MNKIIKKVFIILAVLVLLFICSTTSQFATGAWSVRNFVLSVETGPAEDPHEVAGIVSTIADFEIPVEFDSPHGIQVTKFLAVGYFSESTETYFFIAQLPANLNLELQDLLQSIVERSARGQFTNNGGELTHLGDHTVTIRD